MTRALLACLLASVAAVVAGYVGFYLFAVRPVLGLCVLAVAVGLSTWALHVGRQRR